MTEQQAEFGAQGAQWVPFGNHARWDNARRYVNDRIAAANGRPIAEADHHVFEWTPWGWLRWDAREPGQQTPQQVGVMPPQPSRRARAARWSVARTTLRLGEASAGRVVTTVAAGVLGMSGAVALAVPGLYSLIVAFATGAAAFCAPGGAEFAGLYVRSVEDQRYGDELRRLVALHVKLTTAGAESGHDEIERAAQLGHRLLWDAAGAIAADPQPAQLGEQLTAYEQEFAELARQAVDAAQSGSELDQAVKPPAPCEPSDEAPAAELPPLDALREAAVFLGQLSEAQRYARDQLKHDADSEGA